MWPDLQVLTTNILTKLAQIFNDLLGFLEKALLRINYYGYFFGQLRKKLDHFFIWTSGHTGYHINLAYIRYLYSSVTVTLHHSRYSFTPWGQFCKTFIVAKDSLVNLGNTLMISLWHNLNSLDLNSLELNNWSLEPNFDGKNLKVQTHKMFRASKSLTVTLSKKKFCSIEPRLARIAKNYFLVFHTNRKIMSFCVMQSVWPDKNRQMSIKVAQ